MKPINRQGAKGLSRASVMATNAYGASGVNRALHKMETFSTGPDMDEIIQVRAIWV
jgi:hypothetical protein